MAPSLLKGNSWGAAQLIGSQLVEIVIASHFMVEVLRLQLLSNLKDLLSTSFSWEFEALMAMSSATGCCFPIRFCVYYSFINVLFFL